MDDFLSGFFIVLFLSASVATVLVLRFLRPGDFSDMQGLTNWLEDNSDDKASTDQTSFDVSVFLIGSLLALLFVGLICVIPYAASFGVSGLFGLGSVILFLIMLSCGFLYQWKKQVFVRS